MENIYLEIYSVVGCDLDYDTDEGDYCVFRIDFKNHVAEAKKIKDGIFKVTNSMGEEYIGTERELFEFHANDGYSIFEPQDFEEEFAYDGSIHQEPPSDEDYETDWGSEEFFINKEEALKYYKKELNSAADYINEGVYYYSSKPKR